MPLDRAFWEERYSTGDTGWDIGHVSAPLKAYIDQLDDRDLRMLIPGGGRGHEAEYAHRAGFRRVFVIDIADAPFAGLLHRCPDFPREHLIHGDFFTHDATYDRIIEQTFFCALDPALRPRYVERTHRLLVPGGKLAGVLFDDPLNADHPPFGGSREEYEALFRPHFPTVRLDPCYNSIPPRAGRELWITAERT